MKVVIIGNDFPGNRLMFSRIAGVNDVIGIFYVAEMRYPVATRLQFLRSKIRNHGLLQYLSNKISTSAFAPGWNSSKAMKAASTKYFVDFERAYAERIAPRASYVEEVNCPEFVARLRSLSPDVVVCSGGPIYRAPLIQSVPLMLNYHTGISPIYNGSDTIWWAFANHQPHLCGGTLMVMKETVDGGDILAHYFPGVNSTDDPADLFCKSIVGGASLYNQFLRDFAESRSYTAVQQPKPFLYCRRMQWSCAHNLAVAGQMRSMRRQGYTQPELEVRYWQYTSKEEAGQALRTKLSGLVLGHG